MANEKQGRDEETVEAEWTADMPGESRSADETGPVSDGPEDELARLRQQVAELTDKHLRAVAEHQNYMRRAATERSEMARYASAELLRDFLTVADDLERSLKAAETGEASLLDGVQIIHQNLLRTLGKHHVERIEAKGVPFDPNRHEALMRQPTDQHDPGTVLEEQQAGYTLWDRVLRPAKVIVSAELPGKGGNAGGSETAATEGDE